MMRGKASYNARPWLPICHLDESVIRNMQSPVMAKCMALLGITAKQLMEVGFATKIGRKTVSETFGKNTYLQLKSVMLELSLGRPFDRPEEDERQLVETKEIVRLARVMIGLLAVLDNPHPDMRDTWYAHHLHYKLNVQDREYIFYLDCLRNKFKVKQVGETERLIVKREDLDCLFRSWGFDGVGQMDNIAIFFALYSPERVIFNKRTPSTTEMVVMCDSEWLLSEETGMFKPLKVLVMRLKRWFETGR